MADLIVGPGDHVTESGTGRSYRVVSVQGQVITLELKLIKTQRTVSQDEINKGFKLMHNPMGTVLDNARFSMADIKPTNTVPDYTLARPTSGKPA